MHGIDKAALPECSLAGTPLGLTQSIQDAYELRGAPPFPIEIIQHIIIRAEFNSLCNLSQVNKPFQFCAERIMYRRIGPLSLTGKIRCLRSLTERPTLALNVRSFEAGDLGEEPILFPAFFNLLSCALRHMKLLTELTLLFSGPFSHIFHDTPFSLTKLTSALHWDNVFTSWIVNQRNITAALLCGRFIRNTKLPPSALPRLSRVSASPLILASIVPGRPVKDVEVCLGHPWLFSEDLLATTMKILNFSSGPIESLQIVSHLADTTATTIGAVSVIPRIIPQLNFLALHAVSGAFTTVCKISSGPSATLYNSISGCRNFLMDLAISFPHLPA
jgi:hypothetical protein